jgi:uncharacterized protein (TIGR03083 family)
MEALTPTYTAALFPPLHRELISLLRGLDADAWNRPTVAGTWRVRDVAAHLLDGDLRRLSGTRDGHALAPGRPLRTYDDVVQLINDLNATGVQYGARLSPRLLTDLLEQTGCWISDLFAQLPPHDQAPISVLWAGEERSENWMDVGREYTERWHHQMQIRDAVGADALLDRKWLEPLLDLSVRALPRAYASADAPRGTSVVLEVTGDSGGPWSVVREEAGWRVYRGAAPAPHAVVRIAPDDVWRLLYNALPASQARQALTVEGDRGLAEPLVHTRSVMV